ncbi:MAG: hypothetical protein JST35_05140 [Armatimonadetes bacterium]|nr:hypothetical protein [Armatimonadota bacterium]
MLRHSRLVLLLIPVLASFGCGGSGSSSPQTAVDFTPGIGYTGSSTPLSGATVVTTGASSTVFETTTLAGRVFRITLPGTVFVEGMEIPLAVGGATNEYIEPTLGPVGANPPGNVWTAASGLVKFGRSNFGWTSSMNGSGTVSTSGNTTTGPTVTIVPVGGYSGAYALLYGNGAGSPPNLSFATPSGGLTYSGSQDLGGGLSRLEWTLQNSNGAILKVTWGNQTGLFTLGLTIQVNLYDGAKVWSGSSGLVNVTQAGPVTNFTFSNVVMIASAGGASGSFNLSGFAHN